MRELGPGLWQWETSHPAWEASEPWDRMVSSCAVDDGERLLLFDPLGVPGELETLAGERETAIVLTSPWHERDAQSLVEHLGLTVYTPPPDTAQDLMDKFGVTGNRREREVPTWSGSGRATAARSTCRATTCRSRSTCSPGASTTTSCSGSRANKP